MAKKIVGIYQITCVKNGKRYIGQSKDIKRRFNQHKNSEENPKLRADMENFGIAAFEFEILEECTPEKLTAREDFYLSNWNPEYNIKTAGNGLPEESIEKLRRAKLGQKFTQEHCANISKGKTGKKIAALNKAIQCVETGEIFPSIDIAAESLGIKRANISKVLSGVRDFAGRYSWRYCDETLRARAEEKRIKRQEARFAKKTSESFLQANYRSVQCVETGEVFESVTKAAEWCNVSHSAISRVLRGASKTSGGFHWVYIGEKRNYQTFPKAVRCIETGETFENIKTAARRLGIYPETICRVLKGKQKTANGYHWEYVDEKNQGKLKSKGKSVRCIETGEIFQSIAIAAKFIGVSNQSISQALHGRTESSGGYHWEFVDEQVTHSDRAYKIRAKSVRCIETGEIFNTLREAAEHVGISTAAISHNLHGRTQTAGGYHWEFYTA